MAGKSIDIHPAALAEFKSAVNWYMERSETAANRFVAEIDSAVDLIVASPQRWPAGDRNTRRFVLQRFPYALIYREQVHTIQLLAIAHGHRRPEYWKDRL
jgi:plasmid stabilization system protein ParE